MNEEESPGTNDSGENSTDDSVTPQSAELIDSANSAATTFATMMAQTTEKRGTTSLSVIQHELERAADYAHESLLDDERSFALEELASLHVSQRRTREALKVLTALSVHQAKVYGSEHPVLAKTYMLIGKCHRIARDSFNAVRSLREAVVRYQCADQLNLPDFVETLCQLSQIYRELNKPDLAKIAVKQALTVVSAAGESDTELLQARLLDEFGSLLYDTRQFSAAITMFCKAIALKQSVLGHRDFACANTFVALGMAYYCAREFENAREALMQASLICEVTQCKDRAYKATIFSKLAGTFRVTGRLAEAGMMDDAAKEISGGQTQICLYDGFRKDMEAGYAAEKALMWDSATRSYRQALSMLESFRHRNSAERVAILIRLQIAAESRNQKIQAKTLLIEIESEMDELFGWRQTERSEAARQLSRLFRIQGKHIAADAFLVYAEQEYRRRRSIRDLVSLLGDRAALLTANAQHKEARKAEKLARRLTLKLAGAQQHLELAAPTDLAKLLYQ